MSYLVFNSLLLQTNELKSNIPCISGIFIEFSREGIRDGTDNQKLVATDDGDNSANSLVLDNDSLEESDEKKEIVDRIVGSRLD